MRIYFGPHRWGRQRARPKTPPGFACCLAQREGSAPLNECRKSRIPGCETRHRLRGALLDDTTEPSTGLESIAHRFGEQVLASHASPLSTVIRAVQDWSTCR